MASAGWRPGEQQLRLRPAAKADARRIAELFRISSDGVADYIWDGLRSQYPGCELLEIGRRRYERDGVLFSYQNCLVAETNGEVVGMAHAFIMPEPAPGAGPEPDPVLRPYGELELPGSLYLSGLALVPEMRGRGIGSALLEKTLDRALDEGTDQVSLICFEMNVGAMRLYARHGFTPVDRRPVVPHPFIHYASGDAVLLSRTIG
jgi:GNAT superfamily N-acetyltransferase